MKILSECLILLRSLAHPPPSFLGRYIVRKDDDVSSVVTPPLSPFPSRDHAGSLSLFCSTPGTSGHLLAFSLTHDAEEDKSCSSMSACHRAPTPLQLHGPPSLHRITCCTSRLASSSRCAVISIHREVKTSQALPASCVSSPARLRLVLPLFRGRTLMCTYCRYLVPEVATAKKGAGRGDHIATSPESCEARDGKAGKHDLPSPLAFHCTDGNPKNGDTEPLPHPTETSTNPPGGAISIFRLSRSASDTAIPTLLPRSWYPELQPLRPLFAVLPPGTYSQCTRACSTSPHWCRHRNRHPGYGPEAAAPRLYGNPRRPTSR